jgi:hypothetical protein
MAFDYEEERYSFSTDITCDRLREIGKIAEELGTTFEALVIEAVAKIRKPEPFRVCEPADARSIVVRGVPKNFRGSLREAEDFAANQAERTHEPHTIMVVHKNSLEVSLTAVYRGVQIMATEKVTEDGWGED